MITAERLRELLTYDPETGVFRWVRADPARGIKAGDTAGGRLRGNYIQIGIDRRRYQAARLAWLYMTGEWPPALMDHINGRPENNKWNNLRLATSLQNGRNRCKNHNNTSGYKGVFWDNGKWRARIAGQHLGYYDSPEDAHVAYCAAATKLHGEFFHP